MVKFRSLFESRAAKTPQIPSESEEFYPFTWRASAKGPDYNEGDLIFLRKQKGFGDQWIAIAPNSKITQIAPPLRLPVAEATVPGLRNIPPSVPFEVGDTWTSIPNIPINAVRGTFEVEAKSTESIAGRATTDITPGIIAREWILVDGQSQVIDTRYELENFKAIRVAGTTEIWIRVSFYG